MEYQTERGGGLGVVCSGVGLLNGQTTKRDCKALNNAGVKGTGPRRQVHF
jgi:hypothetical protein